MKWDGRVSGLVRLVFVLVKLPVLIVLTAAQQKGLVFLLLFAAFTNLDQAYPVLGGKLTVVGTILLPALVTWIWIRIGYAWGISARHFFIAGTALGYAGLMGLLKAWIASAGTELPAWTVTALSVSLGLPTLVGAGIIAEVADADLPAATRLMHPEGLSSQLAGLDPLLVIASLVTLILAVRTVNTGRVRWLADALRTPKHRRAEARNRVWSAFSARWALGGGIAGAWRRFRALWTPGPRRLSGDEVIVAADLPGPGQGGWQGLRTRSGLLLGTALSRVGLQFETTSLDLNPFVIARIGAHVMAYGGAGTGKTTGPRNAVMLYRDAPVVSFDVQRNAMDVDIPARIALGRNPLLFDSQLGDGSASINISGRLDPDAPDFATNVRKRSRIILPDAPDTGSNDDLRKRTRSCLATVHAGLILDCRSEGSLATLAEVYQIVRGERLIPFLEWISEHGPVTFRAEAASLAAELAQDDGNLLHSMQFFIGNECAWLAEPAKCSLVDGTTDFVADPFDVVADRGKTDWIIQCDSDEVEDSSAVFQLIILEIIEAHTERPTELCHGLPRTMILVDELPALLPGLGKLFTAILERYRQKGLIAFYMMQSSEQLDRHLGPGTTQQWEKNTSVVIHARPSDPDDAERVSAKVGDGLFQSESHSGAPGGDGVNAEMKVQEALRAISPTEVMGMADGDCLVIARTPAGAPIAFRGRMPHCYHHPYIRRRLQAARRSFIRSQEQSEAEEMISPASQDDGLPEPQSEAL